MTRREQRIAAVGASFGLLVGMAIFFGREFWMSAPGGNTASPPALDSVSIGEPGLPAEVTELQLSAGEQARIGIEVSVVRTENIQTELLVPGYATAPETSLNTVSSRIAGRLESLLVNFTGQTVQEGQAIASIYSPQIVGAAEEYRLALENLRRLDSSQEAEAKEQALALVNASRRKLQLWGITEAQIESISSSPETTLNVLIYSNVAGVVTKRLVTEGQYVDEGEVLLEVTDLSTIWVIADVYQSDLDRVQVGSIARITSAGSLDTALRGIVRLIELSANQETRTVPVRIEVPNPQMRLKPGMYVQTRLAARMPAVSLVVPRSAVIDAGNQKFVYVVAGGGLFERRVIEAGPPAGDHYPVQSGLSAGEQVVTRGAFMIDSQTRLTAGMSGLFAGSKEFTEAPPAAEGATVTFRMDSNPPKGGAELQVHVSVLDASGKPIPDAQVTLALIMPAMPAMRMPESRLLSELKWTGMEYGGSIDVSMAGGWNVVVEVRRGGQVIATHRTRFDAV